MKIVVISVSASALNLLAELAPGWPELELNLHYVGDVEFTKDRWPEAADQLNGGRVVLLDLMGAPQEFCRLVQDRLADFPGQIVVLNSSLPSLRFLTKLGRFSLKTIGRMAEGTKPPDMAKMETMMDRAEKLGRRLPLGPLRDMRNYLWLVKYWLFADKANLTSLLDLLAREYLGLKKRPKPRPPRTREDLSLFHPGQGRVYDSFGQYAAEHIRPDRPSVALLFYNNNYPINTHPAVARLMAAWRDRFNLIPIALNRLMGPDRDRFRQLAAEIDPPLEAVVNLLSFRLGAGPMGGEPDLIEELFRDLNLPLLHPFFLTKQTVVDWRDQLRGANPGEFLISLFLPELDGAVETAALGAMSRSGATGGELELIPDRVDRFGRRLANRLRLRRLNNGRKKAALIFYDYPPGEVNLGTAAFLDVFESLAAILARLKAEGYDLEPMTADQLRDAFLGQGRLNTPKWRPLSDRAEVSLVTADRYRAWTGDSPAGRAVDRAWGKFPGPVMAWQGQAVLPGIINGNVFIGLQPSRGVFEDPSRSYHDKNLPPHHQYLAFYGWLEREFRADAVIHLGTHGTLEFLPGKETALSGDCFPDYLVGDLPHFYFYYGGNPAEAMIAKRRTMAVMISHLPPPYTRAEAYGRLSELENLISELHEAERLDPDRAPLIRQRLAELAGDLGMEADDSGDLEDRLHEWRSALIPGRLHTVGRPFSRGETADFLAQSARVGQGAWTATPGWLTDRAIGLEEFIDRFVLSDRPLPGDLDDAEGRELVRLGRELAGSLLTDHELDGLVNGLAGGYLPAGLGGDAFRSPEVLPSGRNLYQFDPRRVPSPSAVERGRVMARQTLAAFDQGRSYPVSTAVVLWGLETAKTQGETVAQILDYLGVELVRDQTLWEPRLEVIPLERLGRPRIDVTVQMCGFFRDMFPNLVNLLARAFELVADLDEPDSRNHVRGNARALEEKMIRDGQSPDRARELSAARLFGPTASQYGTALTNLVKAKSWQAEGDLVSAYLDSLCHVYTAKHYGLPARELLQGNLSRVELVSQVRSSMDYEITDLDHYYEFLGGLSRSVREASGRPAKIMISDSTTGRTRTEEVGRSIQRGVRTRLLNPKWLDAMLAHPHHGGQQIAARMENMVGLAATTGRVDGRLFDDLADDLVLDEQRRRQIEQNNPFASLEVMERLLEAEARGYWQADEDRLEKLRRLYLKAEADLEEGAEKSFDKG